jgi:hypothetical protein
MDLINNGNSIFNFVFCFAKSADLMVGFWDKMLWVKKEIYGNVIAQMILSTISGFES